MSFSTVEDFQKRIKRYIAPEDDIDLLDPSNLEVTLAANGSQVEEISFWPLVQMIHIHVNSPVLRHGAVLVDLPGSQDADVARDRAAREYLAKVDFVWLVTPITRCVCSYLGVGRVDQQ